MNPTETPFVNTLKTLVNLANNGKYGTREFNIAWNVFYKRKSSASQIELAEALSYIQEDFEKTFRNFPNPYFYKNSIEKKTSQQPHTS